MLIGIKPFKRKTNLEYLERNKEIVCPVNYNHHIKKNGHKNETQRIWCYDCKKSYTITYNTILSHSTLNYEQFKKMLQCMYDLKSLEECKCQYLNVQKWEYNYVQKWEYC